MNENFFNELLRRRKELSKFLNLDEAFCIFSNTLISKGRDLSYSFFQERNFYYFTGLNEPDSCFLFCNNVYTLFLREKDPIKEMWQGEFLGLERACVKLGADRVFDYFNLKNFFSKKLLFSKLHLVISSNHPMKEEFKKFLFKENIQIISFQKTNDILVQLRKKKSSFEKKQITKACDISSEVHNKLLNFQTSQKKFNELTLYNHFLFWIREAGADFEMPYTPIIAGGKNALCLHYNNNDDVINEGDLILIDAAGSYNFYSSDITRTFPIAGKFSLAQKTIYNIVLKVLKKAESILKEGISLLEVHKKSVEFMVDLLIEAEVFTKKFSKEEILFKSIYKEIFPHFIGHYLGLETHDVGKHSDLLEENNIITLEPGLYIRDGNPYLKEEFFGIGIRIEDNFLIGKNNIHNLTEKAIKI